MIRFTSASFVSLSLTCAAPALAEAAAGDVAGAEIVVTGARPQYGARSTTTATRTATAIQDIPQALTVITERQIEDQGLRSIGDVLLFVPGATPGTGESNRDQMTLRGNNSTADFFIDGLRDDVQYFRDLYNVERVEVLRGPNAMIFGRGGGGGIVNRVIKRAGLAASRELFAATDSEGGVRLTADFDQPLAAHAGVRLNAMVEDGNSFRRHVDLNRYAVNPALALLAGPDTRIDLSYEYLHDRRTADRGIPADGSRPIAGFDRVFFGDPRLSFSKADVHLATLGIDHQLSPGVKLRHRTLVGDYAKFYQNIYAADLDEATREAVLAAYNSRNDRRNALTQTDLVWDNRLGGIDQTLLIGVELGRQTSRNRRLTGTLADRRVPLADPTVDAEVVFARAAGDADNRTTATIAALYAQDQIRPAPWLEIVAGLRYDRFRLAVDDRTGAGAKFRRTDDLLSPRIGLVAKPRANLSLYASYSRSYLPQSGDQFSGLTLSTAALKPEKFDNIEIGAKWEPVAGLLATAALYRLDRSNTRAPDPADPTRIALTGAQRSKGLELGLERSVSSRWQVSAGYSWQKAEIRETTAAAPAGRGVPLVPRHSLSLWNRYQLSDRLGAGLGIIARSKSWASLSNAVQLPGYARVDAAGFYALRRGVEAQLNLENLFGADYFPTAHNDNNIAPGAPRTLRGSLRFGF